MAEGDQATASASADGGAGTPSSPAEGPGSVDASLSPMELELEMVSTERDDYRRKLETVEAELAALTAASPDADTINKLQQDNDHLRKTLKKATDMLREKITSCNVQEKKNQALTQQISTLKEVLQVTRDLLNIRNMEVEQLQKNVDSMEARIDDNRRRQTAMIKQMEQATKINGELRNEYETQLRLFQSLKERYEEKVTKLTSLAYERQKYNSEGSDKFEDAADTADRTEATNSSEEIAAEAVSASEIPVVAETSNVSESIEVTEKAASVTNGPETDLSETTKAPEISTPEITTVPQTVLPETTSDSQTVTSEARDASENSTSEITNVPQTGLPETIIDSKTDTPEARNGQEISVPETTNAQEISAAKTIASEQIVLETARDI